jgi:4-alpha-glucanotransferase
MPQNRREIKFQKFVQWLVNEQLTKYNQECDALGLPVFGDLIYAPSRQSADYYYHRNYYLFGVSVGSRPDIFAEGGQNWCLPAVDHRQFFADPTFLLRPAVLMRERGFAGLRVDHGIGRVNPCLIRDGESPLQGYRQFQGPPAEFINFGRDFFRGVTGLGLQVFSENLGDGLPYLPQLMDEFGIGEMGLFRWERKDIWDFILPSDYHALRTMCTSSHDTTPLAEHLSNLHQPENACYANGEQYPPREIGKLRDEAAALVRFLHWTDLPPLNDDLYRDVTRSVCFSPAHQVVFPVADVLACHAAYRDQRKMMINRPGSVNSHEYPYNWNLVFPDLKELFAAATDRAQFIRDYFWDLMFQSGRAPL